MVRFQDDFLVYGVGPLGLEERLPEWFQHHVRRCAGVLGAPDQQQVPFPEVGRRLHEAPFFGVLHMVLPQVFEAGETQDVGRPAEAFPGTVRIPAGQGDGVVQETVGGGVPFRNGSRREALMAVLPLAECPMRNTLSGSMWYSRAPSSRAQRQAATASSMQ